MINSFYSDPFFRSLFSARSPQGQPQAAGLGKFSAYGLIRMWIDVSEATLAIPAFDPADELTDMYGAVERTAVFEFACLRLPGIARPFGDQAL